jgi:DNA-binding NarL/FixJ family response regulator
MHSCPLPTRDGVACERCADEIVQGEGAGVRTTGPGQSALLLLDAVDVLTREQIDYAVIGALAASIHGVVRASVDADAINAVAVAGEAIDVDLVRRLAKRFGREAVSNLEKILGENK